MRRPAGWLAFGVAIGFAIGVAGALSFTQTSWGRGRILAYTVSTLGGRLSGELTIERIDGNIFTGARLYGLALRGYDGVPLALIDSAYIRYRVASFVGGDVVINRLTAWNAEINILRMPGDTAWNYQEILRDPTPSPGEPEDAAATLIERLRLVGSRVFVRGPYEPDSRLSAADQAAALREVLEDTARWAIQEVPGGYLRELRIDVADTALREVYIGPDQRGGIYLEVDDAVADVRLWKDPPLEIRALRAQLHLREGLVNFSAPAFELPDTRGEAVGRIDIRGDRPLYDVVLTTPEFALSDLRWLYPWLPASPAEARGSARVWIEDRPDELLLVTRDLVLEMPGTRITGEFGMLTGDVLRFVDVDLQADPLNMDAVERLLPEELPIEGLVIGSAVIRGQS